MKTMKKYFKVAICFLAFAVCSFLLAFSPTMTAMAAIDYTLANYNLAINSLRMPTTEVKADKDDFLIPLLDSTVDSSFKTFVRVIDPTGSTHEYEIDGENEDAFFGEIVTRQLKDSDKSKKYLEVKSLNNGEYKIVYILKSDSNIYYSNTYRVSVSGVSYSLDFTIDQGTDAGKTYLFPTIVAKDNDTIVLPTAKVVNADGVVKTTVAPVVTKNNKELTDNATTDDDDLKGNVLKFSADSNADDNIYTITYSYNDGSNNLVKKYTIKASNSFKGASELRVASTPKMPSITLGQTGIKLPELAVKNDTTSTVEYNLLSIVISQQGNDGVKQELGVNEYTFDMTSDAFDSNPSYATMYEEKTYNVVYTLEDAYGKTLTKSYSFEVGAPAKPEVFMTYDYDLDSQGKVVDAYSIKMDASKEVKSVYGVESIVVPAIYGRDVISNYEDENFILVRYLESSTGVRYFIDNINLDGVSISDTNSNRNNSGDTNIGKANRAVSFKFNSTKLEDYLGEYELHYRAISKDITSGEASRYTDVIMDTIKVVSTTDAEALAFTPNVSIENIVDNSSIKSGVEMSVKVSYSDEADNSTVDSKYADDNLKTVLMYYYGDENDSFKTTLENAVKSIEATTGYNKYSHAFENSTLASYMTAYTGFGVVSDIENNTFKFIPTATRGKVTIVAVSMNDQGVIDTDSKTLIIKDMTDDEAPEMSEIAYPIDDESFKVEEGQYKLLFATNSSDPMPSNVFEQGKEVVLPRAIFSDDDSQLQMSVSYYVVEDATELSKVKYLYPSNTKFKNGNTIYGGVITTDEIGFYNVVYTATDVAGNTTAYFFTFEVRDSSNPIITVNAKGEDITQSGNVITAEKGTEIIFETLVHSSNMKTNLTDVADIDFDIEAKGLGYNPTGTTEYSYMFNSVGTYVININASYNDTNFGRVRNAEAKTIVVNITPKTLEWINEFNIDEFVDKSGEPVYLPKVAASDDAEVSVVVKKQNGTKELEVTTITDANGVSKYMFTPADKGVYKVVYTAVSEDAKITKEFSIKVGDHIAPTIKINYENELAQDIEYTGEDISYTFDVITSSNSEQTKKFVIKVSSNGKEIYRYDLGMMISDRDENGQVSSDYSWSSLNYKLTTENGSISGSGKEYTISGTGKYTLTISVQDGYENKAEKVISFNVVDKAEAKTVSDTVVGAILIVISLIVLGGVILFFLLTGKKSGSKKAKRTKKSDVKEESIDENIVIETESSDKE